MLVRRQFSEGRTADAHGISHFNDDLVRTDLAFSSSSTSGAGEFSNLMSVNLIENLYAPGQLSSRQHIPVHGKPSTSVVPESDGRLPGKDSSLKSQPTRLLQLPVSRRRHFLIVASGF